MTAPYWSLITLLGRTMDSSRSRGLKRPPTPVRSGPTRTPSIVEAVAGEAADGGEEGSAAVEVAPGEPLLDDRGEVVERPRLDERPVGRDRHVGLRPARYGVEDRLELGLLGLAQVRDRLVLDVLEEEVEAGAPLVGRRLQEPGEVRLAQRRGSSRSSRPAGARRSRSAPPGSGPAPGARSSWPRRRGPGDRRASCRARRSARGPGPGNGGRTARSVRSAVAASGAPIRMKATP